MARHRKARRYSVPHRCGRPARFRAPNGYRACERHALPRSEFFAAGTNLGPCDFPMDALGAARVSKRRNAPPTIAALRRAEERARIIMRRGGERWGTWAWPTMPRTWGSKSARRRKLLLAHAHATQADVRRRVRGNPWERLGGEPVGSPRIYRTIRFHFNGKPRTLRNNLTLAEAQAHCSRKDTSSHSTGPGAWFDGYDYMRGKRPKER